jgi:hypothetical protein
MQVVENDFVRIFTHTHVHRVLTGHRGVVEDDLVMYARKL